MTSDTPNHISNNVPDMTGVAAYNMRSIMRGQRKSGKELAGVLGTSQQSASRRMHGQTPLDTNELVLIAEWLNVTVEQLVQPPPAPVRP